MINTLDMLDMADALNKLPFVTWDRYTTYSGYTDVYGWIERDDRHADFVIVTFEGGAFYSAVTSSAARSHEIDRILRGTDEGHVDCRRVDADFADLVTRTTKAAA